MREKKLKKKVFLIVLILCVVLALFPVGASAEGLKPPDPKMAQTFVLNAAGDPSGAYDALTQEQKALYDALKVWVCKVAAGEITSTVFEGFAEELFFAENEDAQAAVGNALDALYADLPYDFYWRDMARCIQYIIGEIPSEGSTLYFVHAIYFCVAENYSADGTAGTFATDPEKIAKAQKAVSEAKRVVAENAQKSDIEKLRAYKDYICGKVSYDDNAAANGPAGSAAPWHLINVFDDDPETNVVCEGYAKAFQYLCDLSEFNSDVKCYRPSGILTCINYEAEEIPGEPFSASHAWNIVHMNGQSYLIDVTNCDSGKAGAFIVGEDGSIKEPEGEQSGDIFFMLYCKGVNGSDILPDALKVSGSVDSGYTVDRDNIRFFIEGGSWRVVLRNIAKYEYDDVTRKLYSDEVLSLDVLEPLPENKLGDVSGDGEVNAIDARWLLQASSGKRTLTEEEAAVADVNKDTYIDVIDARWLLQVSSGNRIL